ncbi:hypothetical protein ABTX81_01635 [Kitasatospora sp. NPDC097605]|uniref:hypothetical protein n=1 Tax=Kitasatospora sp. NPDC097605 TaxID=3157226 RepID=UPI00332410B6
MNNTACPRKNRRRKLLVRGLLITGIASVGAFGALSVYGALAHHTVDSFSLTVCGASAILTLGAARSWDDLTDADVLALLSTTPLPCSSDDLARRLGRQPGPVRLSLARLERARQVLAVDANGTVRYTAH